MQGVRLQRNADASHHTSASVDDLQTGDTSISIAINGGQHGVVSRDDQHVGDDASFHFFSFHTTLSSYFLLSFSGQWS